MPLGAVERKSTLYRGDWALRNYIVISIIVMVLVHFGRLEVPEFSQGTGGKFW